MFKKMKIVIIESKRMELWTSESMYAVHKELLNLDYVKVILGSVSAVFGNTLATRKSIK